MTNVKGVIRHGKQCRWGTEFEKDDRWWVRGRVEWGTGGSPSKGTEEEGGVGGSTDGISKRKPLSERDRGPDLMSPY